MTLPPAPDPTVLRARGRTVRHLPVGTTLWRVHLTEGDHVLPWDQSRRWGPGTGRFDPHDPPPRLHERVGVLYLALDLTTAVAEVYQQTRRINRRRGAPCATAFETVRGLDLLDLTGSASLRLGAAATINADDSRRVTQGWARAIRAAWPEVPGLWHSSAMDQAPCVTLFESGTGALPPHPSFSRPLAHPGLRTPLDAIAHRIGCTLL